MNLYVSRSGQTFGPYTMEQAKTFLDSNQLLATDYALVEGTTDWKLLPELLSNYSAQTKDIRTSITEDSNLTLIKFKYSKFFDSLSFVIPAESIP